MVEYTTRHNLESPTGPEAAGRGRASIQKLAEDLDTKLDISSYGKTMKVARHLCSHGENTPNLPGYLIIDTKIPATLKTVTLDIRGYCYMNYGNIIDLTVSTKINNDGSYTNGEVANRGSFPFKRILIMTKTSTGTFSVALEPDTVSKFWHYPKIWVSGSFARTETPDSQLKGWTIQRASDPLTAYSVRGTLFPGWVPIQSFSNGWVNFDVRTAEYMKCADGWVRFRGIIKNGTVGNATAFTMPLELRPDITVQHEHHFVVASNSAFGMVAFDATTGAMKMYSGSNVWFDLSSIAYRVGRAA